MKKRKFCRGRNIAMAILLGLALLSGTALASGTENARADSYDTVDVSQTMQTVDGWGTSLCWWANAAGGWDMEGTSGKQKREEIVDLVFGKDGLDLNIARYNIPGGDDPAHDHMINCRGMTLLKPSADADYDWDADANQMWILDAAYKLRDADLHVETFNNSAPYWMTNTGCSSGGATKSQENLPVENYAAYAKYYVDVLNYIQTEMKIPVKSVEVMNEPGSDYWGALGTQEGCKVLPGDHQSQLIQAVYDEIKSRNLKSSAGGGTDFIFAAPDETNPGLAYTSYNALSETAKNIVGKLNYHIYSKTDNDRRNMGSLAGYSQDYSTQTKKIWQSEICYGTGANRPDDYPNDHNTMIDAFDIADDIYGDFYDAHVNAWIIWQIIESELENMEKGCNYGLLHGVYQEPGNSEFGFDLDAMALNRGDYFITKQYYAMGQYSRYIKPGYKIVKSPSRNYVIAVSPDKDELVIVYKNKEAAAQNVNLYLKGFNAVSAKKIVTDPNANWAESEAEVSGSYADFTASAESITTLVIRGEPTESASESGIFFKNFIHRANTLRAEFQVENSAADYAFYYADSKEKLPVFGGTGATRETLEVTENNFAVTVKNATFDAYYGVLAATSGGQTHYSRVLAADGSQKTTDEFTYLTLAGKTNKMSLEGTGYSFGGFYGVTDQPFGEDPFTGMEWGYVDGTGKATAEYSSDTFAESARYSLNDTLTYKYQVTGTGRFTVTLLFLDPWKVSDRAMQIDVNGKKAEVTRTDKLTAVHINGVQGARENGKRYITVTLTEPSGASQAPCVNLIAVQSESQAEQIFGVKPVQGLVINQGEKVRDALPAQLELITSKGTAKTGNVEFRDIDYADGLKQGGGGVTVSGVAEGRFPFSFTVATRDTSEETYYYIDTAALAPGSELSDAFDVFKQTNPKLINTDAIDKYAANENDWGRIGTANDYAEYYRNSLDKTESILEGKLPITVDGSNRNAVQYRLTNLPKGAYSVVVGVFTSTWSNDKRGTLVTKMGDTELGSHEKYSASNEWVYTYQKTDDAPIVFTIYSTGSHNPVLSYLIVKTTSGAGEKPRTPILPANVTKNTTELTVSGIHSEGTLLIVTDNANRLIAEHTVTAQEKANGKATLSGLDLSESTSLRAVQYKDGNASTAAETEFATFEISKPRIEWSAASDTISVLPSGNNIKAIDYRDGSDGEWINIKNRKFFRASHNGVYYVRLTTTENVEIIQSVEVTHVDSVEMRVVNDLTAWVDEAYVLTLDFSASPLDIVSVTVDDGTASTDVTDTKNGKTFTYPIADEGHFTITAVSSLGTTRTFEIDGCKFEKIPANIDYEWKIENGITFIGFSSESVGGVEYSYSINGGEFTRLYQAFIPLIKEGEYVYKATNKPGKEATVNIVYADTFKENAPIYATLDKNDEAHEYAFTFAQGLENIRFIRLDGDGKEVRIDNGVAKVTESGSYAVIAEKGNTLYVTQVYVNRYLTEETPNEPTESGCSSAFGGGMAYVSLAALGLTAVLVTVRRKKSNV